MKKKHIGSSGFYAEFFKKIDNNFGFLPGEIRHYSKYTLFEQLISLFEITKSLYEKNNYSSLLASFPYDNILDHVLKPQKASYYMNAAQHAKAININSPENPRLKNAFISDSKPRGIYDLIMIDHFTQEKGVYGPVSEDGVVNFNIPLSPPAEIDFLFNKNLSENGRLICLTSSFTLAERLDFKMYVPSSAGDLFNSFKKESALNNKKDLFKEKSGFSDELYVPFRKKYTPYLEGIIRLPGYAGIGVYALVFCKEIKYDFYVGDLERLKTKDFISLELNSSERISKSSSVEKTWSVKKHFGDFIDNKIIPPKHKTIKFSDFINNYAVGFDVGAFSFSGTDGSKAGEEWHAQKNSFYKLFNSSFFDNDNKKTYRVVCSDSIINGAFKKKRAKKRVFVPEKLITNYLLYVLAQQYGYNFLVKRKSLDFFKSFFEQKLHAISFKELVVSKGDLIVSLDQSGKPVSCIIKEPGDNLIVGKNTLLIKKEKHNPQIYINYINAFINSPGGSKFVKSFLYRASFESSEIFSLFFPIVNKVEVSSLLKCNIPLINNNDIERIFKKTDLKKRSDENILIMNMLKSSEWDVKREQRSGKLIFDFGLFYNGSLVSYLEIKDSLSNDHDIKNIQERHKLSGLERGLVCFKNKLFICGENELSETSGIPNPGVLFPGLKKTPKTFVGTDINEIYLEIKKSREINEQVLKNTKKIKKDVSIVKKGMLEVLESVKKIKNSNKKNEKKSSLF